MAMMSATMTKTTITTTTTTPKVMKKSTPKTGQNGSKPIQILRLAPAPAEVLGAETPQLIYAKNLLRKDAKTLRRFAFSDGTTFYLARTEDEAAQHDQKAIESWNKEAPQRELEEQVEQGKLVEFWVRSRLHGEGGSRDGCLLDDAS